MDDGEDDEDDDDDDKEDGDDNGGDDNDDDDETIAVGGICEVASSVCPLILVKALRVGSATVTMTVVASGELDLRRNFLVVVTIFVVVAEGSGNCGGGDNGGGEWRSTVRPRGFNR